MNAAALHLFQQHADLHSFGNVIDRMQQLLEVQRLARPDLTQEVFLVEDALQIVEPFPVHRVAGEFVLVDVLQEIRSRGIDLDGAHLGARDHHLFDRHVGELEDAGDQFLLGLVEDALLLSFLHEQEDLFGGDEDLFALSRFAQQSENAAAGPGQGANAPSRHPRQPCQGTRRQQR